MTSTSTGRRLNQTTITMPDPSGLSDKARLTQEVKRQNMLDLLSETEEKSALKRQYRQEAAKNREIEIQESIIRAQTDKVLRQQAMEQEERLAKELERLKLEKLKDQKMRQQLRETSYELRELEAKLREAYVAKERHAQVAEKEAHKFDDMLEDAQIMKRMKEEAERARREDEEKHAFKIVEKARYKEDLTKQLEEKEYARQKAYEEFLKEKLIIDEIVRKIYEEDQKEMERKMIAQKVTAQYVEEFKRQRELWKQRERAIMEEENRKIIAYANITKERDDTVKAIKIAREEAMNKLQQKLFEDITKERETREEMERVRQELYLEEQEQKVRHHEREEMERKFRQRVDLQKQHQIDIELKQVRQFEEMKEEERIKQEMLAKFAQDDKIEQMNMQKRRMKQLEHKHQVEKLLEERRRRMNEDKQRELQERVEAERLESHKRNIIEEERIKMLREHATRLLGYLPKGVIRDEKDLDALGVEFKQEYAKKQIDFFGDDKRWEK